MPLCPTCSADLERPSAFCPSCGSSLQGDDDARTVLTTTPTPAPAPTSGRPASSPPSPPPLSGISHLSSTHAAWLHSHSSSDGGFAPGVIVGGRFRIVGLLGRGGMGEVYRADDLVLAQPVALKFLPRELAADPERLARFYAEVRIARQVSHPSVCRVYDIGEIEGQPYLSMEHVDGDDLSSLLRRIGRLPADKGLDVARQLCAGLAAAHQRGVLHRDLKPANILIDAQGKVRITDFGLAVLAGSGGAGEKRAGTPAYMAPEQLARNEVSIQSDIYSLGLVLYEIFTGKRAFRGNTLLELERTQRDMPENPTTVISDLDPVIERAILRCLERDPAQRPESALAVAASLPGGDPLAAALAAGELPSPEIVAAAGGIGALRRRAAWTALAVFLAGMVVLVATAGRVYLLGRVAQPKPSAVLQERAGELLAVLGYDGAVADRAWSYGHNHDYLRWVREQDSTAARWDDLANTRVPSFQFWHRRSARSMLPWNPGTGGRVTFSDPPRNETGMTSLVLDTQGRLLWFEAVPPQIDSTQVAGRGVAVDWRPLFVAAGLDTTRFAPAASIWVPGVHCDTRVAWTGTVADLPEVPLRVEAASFGGRVAAFAVIAPWTRANRMLPPAISRRDRTAQTVNAVLLFALLAGGCAAARHHLLTGRGDRRGATRLALAILALGIFSWLMAANHVASISEEWQTFVVNLGTALFLAGLVWVLYLALEPYVRQRSPDSLISWNRLLAGRGARSARRARHPARSGGWDRRHGLGRRAPRAGRCARRPHAARDGDARNPARVAGDIGRARRPPHHGHHLADGALVSDRVAAVPGPPSVDRGGDRVALAGSGGRAQHRTGVVAVPVLGADARHIAGRSAALRPPGRHRLQLRVGDAEQLLRSRHPALALVRTDAVARAALSPGAHRLCILDLARRPAAGGADPCRRAGRDGRVTR